MTDNQQKVTVRLKQQERYRFSVDFGFEDVGEFLVDEDPPLGKAEGPDPSRLLGAAIAHCMLSSLLYCLDKSRSKVDNLEATANVNFGRNEENRLRINSIDLDIRAKVPDTEISKIERCKGIFDKFCTVSQSVQKGIPIKFDLNVE